MCALCLKDDSSALAVGAPALFLNRPNCDDARSFYTWHWPKQKGGAAAAGSAFQFRVKGKFVWREDEGIECRRAERLGGAAKRSDRKRGRDRRTGASGFFGRKQPSLEVFEINSMFAFPCS